MSTALDEVLESKQAQEYWFRRLIALVIDALILWLPVLAISGIAWNIGFLGQGPWLISGVLVLLYSALFEAELGYTIGKRIMNLEVVSLDGRPYDLQRGLVRNLSKIHVILLVLDWLGGLLAENRVNMRYLDIVTRCEVVDSQVALARRAQGLTPPPAGAREEAGVTVQAEGEEVEPAMPPEVEPPSEDELQEDPVEEEEEAPGIPPPPVPEPPGEEGPEEVEALEEGEVPEEVETPKDAETPEEAEEEGEGGAPPAASEWEEAPPEAPEEEKEG